MKSKSVIFTIAGVQVILSLLMWYLALLNSYKYQAYWAILLAVNIMLVALVMLVILRYYIKRSELYG